MSAPNSPPPQFSTVGVGASAGGLDAFLDLFRNLSTPSNMAFVLVTHLEPSHESQLADIVSRVTNLHVLKAENQCRVEPDHLYILPPNAEIEIREGILHLTPRPETQPHYPIDRFFQSLAADQGPGAVGIILSGGGMDGADGIRAIKSHYGLTFCQEPQTAQHPSMPHSAIATGAVDVILPPAEIAQALRALQSRGLPAPIDDEEFDETSQESRDFSRILAQLRVSHSVDFSQYKPSTVSRRIGRRVLVHNLSSLAEYASYLETHPLEVDELYRDILICVTSFFREPAMFEALRGLVHRSLAGRKSSDPYRIWVAGCATGEEVYSFSMAIVEVIEASGRQIPIQVFGTDISNSAIDRARAGIFSEKIQEEISPERLRRFFNRVDSGYRIAESIRQKCIFAHHDVTADPPFSQMDLVSCRNVLIYLNTASQSRVLPALHYGLKSGGYLVLGSAETIGNRTDLFAAANQEQKIFSKKAVPLRLAIDFTSNFAARPVPDAPTPVAQLDAEVHGARILRDLYAPPGVIVSPDLQVIHFHGQTNLYLGAARGEASLNLLRLARESLVHPLRRLMNLAIERKAPVSESGIRVEQGDQTREITVRVIPVPDKLPSYLVLFEDAAEDSSWENWKKSTAASHAPDSATADLQLVQAQQDIVQIRDHLRKVVEQHEAANEELRAANEEARSANEELHSTNEELRTAKEELQSSNEELITVNDELKNRNEELRLATNDLSNVLSSAAIPIVMVDMDQRVRRFTPAAERLLSLAPSDIGQKISDVRQAFPLPTLNRMLSDAVERLQSASERAQDWQGRWYEISVRPYRTSDDRIEGAIVTFLDIDQATRALQDVANARSFAEAIVETVQHPLVVLDANLCVLQATEAFYRTFDVSRADTEGRSLSEVGAGQWNFPELAHLLDAALIRDVPFKDLDVEHEFPRIGRRTMRLNARRIVGATQQRRLLLSIEDVTERKETAEIQYRRLFESARDAVVIIEAWSGKVVDVNPYFSELTRYQRADVVGKLLWDLDVFVESEEMRRLVPETRGALNSRYESVRVTARDGTELVLELIANSYRVREKEYIQLNIRDVTDRRRMEERLRSSNADLQQFAFATSHDLQEPLRTITGFSELIQRRLGGHPDEEVIRYLDFVINASARMRQMVLDLLGYSQVVRADVQPTDVRSDAVLSSVLMNLQMAVDSSKAQVTFDPLPVVSMDQAHLTQLLQNLIGNALKYRGPDPPRIHLSAKDAGREWLFSVSDNGIGIDPQYAEHVFAVFKRLHGKDYPGSGIGLAICKRIVERYGGRIWVESSATGGSVFRFTIAKVT